MYLKKPACDGLHTPIRKLYINQFQKNLKGKINSQSKKLKLRDISIFTSTLFALLLAGCQSAPFSQQTSAPVIPRADATFETSGFGETKNAAISEAMNNANITCRGYKNTRVVVTQDEVKYNGIVDEKTGALIDKAGQVIGILSGQKMPKASSETDFEAQIIFKCVSQ